ncbi:hypothetical protein O59_001390 [Cellvibrio sp. BR]|nr:hypothetical protein O59_001390 [Cellvibrio sp. BR]
MPVPDDGLLRGLAVSGLISWERELKPLMSANLLGSIS